MGRSPFLEQKGHNPAWMKTERDLMISHFSGVPSAKCCWKCPSSSSSSTHFWHRCKARPLGHQDTLLSDSILAMVVRAEAMSWRALEGMRRRRGRSILLGLRALETSLRCCRIREGMRRWRGWTDECWRRARKRWGLVGTQYTVTANYVYIEFPRGFG